MEREIAPVCSKSALRCLTMFALLSAFTSHSQPKGKLLLEESEEGLRERTKQQVRFHKFSIVLIVVMSATMVTIFGLVAGVDALFWWMAAIFTGAVVVSVPVLLFGMRRRPRPFKIYENGIDVEMGNILRFYSYGEIQKVIEQKIPLSDKSSYLFKTKNPLFGFPIRKNTIGLDEIVKWMKPKFGKPEFLVKVERTEEERRAARRYEYSMYFPGLYIGIPIIIIFFFGLYFGAFTFSYYFLDVVLMGPILIIALTTLFTVTMTRMKKFIPPKLNLKIPALIIVGVLPYFFITVALSDAATQSIIHPSMNIGPEPGSSVLIPGTYVDSTFDVLGNIVVEEGQTLSLRNSVVLMNLSSDKEFGIWVAKGGTLILENSTIRSSSQFVGYTFEIMGSATITGSDISGIWGNEEQVNLDGGIEIYSSEVIIESSYIHHARTNGILVVNSNPLISNSTVEFADDDCVELQNSDATILNNTINSCSWGLIVMRGSNPTIKGNIISRNLHGAYVAVVSNPIIVDNSFEHNRYYGLEIDDDCDPSMSGNTYSWNGEDVIMGRQWNRPDICISTTVIVATVCLSVLFIVQRKRLTEERGLGTI